MKKKLMIIAMAALTLTGCGKSIPKLENGQEAMVEYADGTKIQAGDTLDKGQSKSFILNLEYSGTKLPQNVVEISGLSIALIYVQK